MGTVSIPNPTGAVWAVIDPNGELSWYGAGQMPEVERLCGGKYGPLATESDVLDGRIRLMVSSFALTDTAAFPDNRVAAGVVHALSSGRLRRLLRGTVAICQYDADGLTGELGQPTAMDADTYERVEQTHHAVRGLLGGRE